MESLPEGEINLMAAKIGTGRGAVVGGKKRNRNGISLCLSSHPVCSIAPSLPLPSPPPPL